MIDLTSLNFWAGTITGGVVDLIALLSVLVVVAWKRHNK